MADLRLDIAKMGDAKMGDAKMGDAKMGEASLGASAGAKARGERGKNSPASRLRASAAPLWEKTSQGGAPCANRSCANVPLRHCANRPQCKPLWRAGLAQAHATLDPPPGASAPLRQAQINHEALAQRMDQSF